MSPSRIVYGIVALAVPMGFVAFGLLMAVVTGWRRWFNLPPKKLPPKQKDE